MTRRLLIGYLSLTLFVLVILEVPLGLAFARQELDELTAQVERDAFAIASFVEDTMEGTADADLDQLADRYLQATGGRLVIVDADGDAIVDSEPPSPGPRNFASRPEIAAALDGRVATGTRTSDTLGTKLLYVAVPVASGGHVHGAVRLTYPTSEVDERVRRNWIVLGAVASVSLAAAVVVGISLAGSVVRPLRRVQAAATDLGGGDLGARAPVDAGPPEVRTLAAAFNDTAGRLEELVRSQEAFVADASHQLRTPLTALRLRLENLEHECTAEGADDLTAALTEVSRLSRLVDGLLALARADRTSAGATAVPVDVRPVLDDRANAWSPVAAERAVDLVVSCPDGVAVRATPDRLVQVLDNLVANALEVSPSGARITLSADPVGDKVEVHVVDEGPGMTAEQRTHAFDRFWRADRDRGVLGGTGLGLSIVQKLVRADGGEVELREAGGGGLDAVISVPAAPR